jgi:hypothetical protein
VQVQRKSPTTPLGVTAKARRGFGYVDLMYIQKFLIFDIERPESKRLLSWFVVRSCSAPTFSSVPAQSPGAFVCALKDHLANVANFVNALTLTYSDQFLAHLDKVWIQLQDLITVWTAAAKLCRSAQRRDFGAMKVRWLCASMHAPQPN